MSPVYDSLSNNTTCTLITLELESDDAEIQIWTTIKSTTKFANELQQEQLLHSYIKDQVQQKKPLNSAKPYKYPFVSICLYRKLPKLCFYEYTPDESMINRISQNSPLSLGPTDRKPSSVAPASKLC